MKTMKVLFISLLSAMLFVCGDAFGREKEGSMGKTKKSDIHIFMSKEYRSYEVYSENYYVIDGHKVALKYIYTEADGIGLAQSSFSFSDCAAKFAEEGYVPFFDWEKGTCDVVWDEGCTYVFRMINKGDIYGGNEVKRIGAGDFIISETNEFHEKFNEQKKFTITVPVADGKRYKYKFDIRKFGDISVH